MFLYFFEDYKEKIYKGSRRKLKWYEILMISLIFLGGLICALFLTLKANYILTLSFFCFYSLYSIGIVIYSNILFNKNRKLLLKNYKESHIEPLNALLRDYNLFTLEGIDWAVDCCKDQRNSNHYTNISKPISRYFMTIVYPIVTLCLGLMLKDISKDDVIVFIGIMIVLFGMGVMSIISLRPAVEFMLFPEKNIVEYMEKDLKYAKTQLIKSTSSSKYS